MTDYTLTGSTAEMRATITPADLKRAQERLGLEAAAAMDKAQDAHLDHATHAMQCAQCDKTYQRIAKLERKAKKWKRRAKTKPVTMSRRLIENPVTNVRRRWKAEKAEETSLKSLACGCLICEAHTAKVATLDGSWTQQSQAEQSKGRPS